MSDLVRVAVDAMGGDYAPVEPVKGAVEAVNADERVKVQLVGQVDVIEKEPMPADHPLLSIPNFTMTPHMGMYSEEAVGAVSLICAQNVAAMAKGEPLKFQVV